MRSLPLSIKKMTSIQNYSRWRDPKPFDTLPSPVSKQKLWFILLIDQQFNYRCVFADFVTFYIFKNLDDSLGIWMLPEVRCTLLWILFLDVCVFIIWSFSLKDTPTYLPRSSVFPSLYLQVCRLRILWLHVCICWRWKRVYFEYFAGFDVIYAQTVPQCFAALLSVGYYAEQHPCWSHSRIRGWAFLGKIVGRRVHKPIHCVIKWLSRFLIQIKRDTFSAPISLGPACLQTYVTHME